MDSDEMASSDAVNECVARIERREMEEAQNIESGEQLNEEPEEMIIEMTEPADEMAEISEPSCSSEKESFATSKVTLVRQKIECSKCQSESSTYWRTTDDGNLLCVVCSSNTVGERSKDSEENGSQGGSDSPVSVENDEADEHPEQDESQAPKAPSPRKREVRRATRMKTAKSVKNLVKSRRTQTFKKTIPTKTTPSVAHFITTKYVRHKGSYLQSGDVVSMLGDDDEIYYAQLRTFFIDQFGEISATITWLVPTERSPSDGSFDAPSFVMGPEEDFPRDIRPMNFECNAPSDYYLSRSRPIMSDERRCCKAFVWTSLGIPRPVEDLSTVEIDD